MGQKEMAMTGKNRIMIYGPKNDVTYIVEFRTADGEALAISIPGGEARVIRHFQERMPYGLFTSREIRGNAVRNNVKNLAPGRLDAGSRAAQKKAPRERG
jgi:hypothetical protein